MNSNLNSVVVGFTFGIGAIVAAVVMRLLFHVNWCAG